MTAIKKKNTKTASPAPVAKVSTAKSKNNSSTPARALVANPVSVTRASQVSAVKSKPVVTTITARIDTGFGNVLYIRGDGPGLSWTSGVPMACVTNDEWQLTLTESSRPVAFKLLLNDVTWSQGEDFTVASGSRVTVSPGF